MAKLIITVEGGKVTQTLNFLDRNENIGIL